MAKNAVRPAPRSPVVAKPPVSDAAVRAKTGRTWAEWAAVLDRAKAGEMTHREIALMLRETFGVGDWWCQMVTVGYERLRGRRAMNETSQGFRANTSRTVGASVAAAFKAWTEESTRTAWLGNQQFTVRTSIRNKSMRITWPDGTDVEVQFTSKGAHRSIVAVQHGKLTGAAAVRGAKAFWAEHLESLRRTLER